MERPTTDELAALIGPVAELLLGKTTSQNGNEQRHGSLIVNLAKGTFLDEETGGSGTTYHLIEQKRKCDRSHAFEWLVKSGLWNGSRHEEVNTSKQPGANGANGAAAPRVVHTKPNARTMSVEDPKAFVNGLKQDDAEIARLAALTRIDYERERETTAKTLGFRVSILDDLVKKEHRKAIKANSEPERSPLYSDDALALQFADRHQDQLRYLAELGKWLVWDDTRWDFDKTLIARDRARHICREAALQCNATDDTPKLIVSAKTISAVERLAMADRRIAAVVDELDTEPWLLNTPGGTVDLRTGLIKPHDPANYITKITGVTPDWERPTPLWDAFLTRIFGKTTELVPYLQRMSGYCLTGLTIEHALFFLFGLGANGKTTFLNALIACLGEYHQATPIETFTASNQDRHPTELAGLRGARLVTAVETEEGRRWAESRIKALTGGEKISARFMRQDFFNYLPQFKLMIAGNHKPGLRSVDEAIRRRFNLLPFTETIPPEERDPEFSNKLKPELPGILAWMIDGCVAWQEQGLAPPQVVTAATEAYLEAEDAVSAWIEECCERKADAYASRGDLFVSWSAWATKTGEFVGSQKRFVQALEARSFMRPHRDKHGRGFYGLCIASPDYR